MRIIHDLLHVLVHGLAPRLKPYEEECLARFAATLPAPAADIFAAQLTHLKERQRWSDGKELVFFLPDQRTPFRRFENDEGEVCAALAVFVASGSERELRCRVLFTEGRLSRLYFLRNPGRELSRGFQIQSFVLKEDLTRHRRHCDAPASCPMMQRLTSQFELRDIARPLCPDDREAALSGIDEPLPADYVSLIHETDGFVAGEWTFLGTRVRTFPLPDFDYIMLADADPLSFGLVRGVEPTQLLLLDQEAEEAFDLGSAFFPALMRALEMVRGSAAYNGLKSLDSDT